MQHFKDEHRCPPIFLVWLLLHLHVSFLICWNHVLWVSCGFCNHSWHNNCRDSIWVRQGHWVATSVILVYLCWLQKLFHSFFIKNNVSLLQVPDVFGQSHPSKTWTRQNDHIRNCPRPMSIVAWICCHAVIVPLLLNISSSNPPSVSSLTSRNALLNQKTSSQINRHKCNANNRALISCWLILLHVGWGVQEPIFVRWSMTQNRVTRWIKFLQHQLWQAFAGAVRFINLRDATLDHLQLTHHHCTL